MAEKTWEHDNCQCTQQTEKALLVKMPKDRGANVPEEMWMPVSQIEEDSDIQAKGDRGTLVTTEWIARQKGLIEG